MSDFTPKTRLEKILCGVATVAKTRLEKAVKYAVDHAGGGGGVFEMNVNVSVDTETGKQTITADATAEELFDAIESGKVVEALFNLPDGEGQLVATKNIFHCTAVMLGGSIYGFKFFDSDEDAGTLSAFVATDLAADDTVVFTQV